jgi:plastocyanin
MKKILLGSIIIVFAVGGGLVYGQDGTITGTVKFIGTPPDQRPYMVPSSYTGCGKEKSLDRLVVGNDGGVANAVVSIEGAKAKKEKASASKYVIDQKDCEYKPHVLVVKHGDAFTVENSDPLFHNVHVYFAENHTSAFNIAEPVKGMKVVQRVRKPGMYLLECDVHPWMNCYVYVAGDGYAAVTDTSGSYTITGVPPGKYKLVMWHEGWDTKVVSGKPEFSTPTEDTQEVTVEAGKTVTANFTLK